MSNTKHTPGPWFLPSMAGPYHVPGTTASGKGDWCYYINSKKAHEFCPASAHGPSAEEAEANARLIAAAPELLEALQLIANALSPNSLPVNGMMASYDHALMVREEADRCFEIARAAIAKAAGQ
jgi:hypothetical protein